MFRGWDEWDWRGGQPGMGFGMGGWGHPGALGEAAAGGGEVAGSTIGAPVPGSFPVFGSCKPSCHEHSSSRYSCEGRLLFHMSNHIVVQLLGHMDSVCLAL